MFATNIKPAELVDEAFLRRIQYKILRREPDGRGVPAHLRKLLPRARDRVRPALVERLLNELLPAPGRFRCEAASPAT